ncbi:MAG: hypothetical protein K2P79_01520 [Sphingomonas sp.]|nr:hypothetical protein [Sphingomonas sp.]
MDTSTERQLHKRRALQERAMTAAAACVEAAIAHDGLTILHIAECALCEHGRTAECADCDMQAICEATKDVLQTR